MTRVAVISQSAPGNVHRLAEAVAAGAADTEIAAINASTGELLRVDPIRHYQPGGRRPPQITQQPSPQT